MIFILRRSVWWPRLLGGGMVEWGYLRWSPGVWRPEDGSQPATFPATCRDLPRLPQPAETSQPAQCRAAAVGPPPRGEWSADYHHQPAQPAANNSSPSFTPNLTKYFWEHANIFDPNVKHTNITQSDILKFLWNEIKLQLLFGICWIVAACWMNCFPLSSHCPTSLLVSTQISRSCHCTSKLKYLGVSSEPSRRNETGNLIFLGGEQSGVESIVWQLAKTDE